MSKFAKRSWLPLFKSVYPFSGLMFLKINTFVGMLRRSGAQGYLMILT